jgi:hypothetical protein
MGKYIEKKSKSLLEHAVLSYDLQFHKKLLYELINNNKLIQDILKSSIKHCINSTETKNFKTLIETFIQRLDPMYEISKDKKVILDSLSEKNTENKGGSKRSTLKKGGKKRFSRRRMSKRKLLI